MDDAFTVTSQDTVKEIVEARQETNESKGASGWEDATRHGPQDEEDTIEHNSRPSLDSEAV